MPRTYRIGDDSLVVSEAGKPPRYHFGIVGPGKAITFTLTAEPGTALEAIVAKAVRSAAARKGAARGRDSGH